MKIELLKKWKKKKIFSSETMWKNLITQPDDMKQFIMFFFFFFIIKFQSMIFTYDDCALYHQIKTLINF